MAAIDITQFKGIAPNVEADVGFAATAEGVDLSGGILRGFPTNTLTATGHSGEFVYFNDTWLSGGENYIETTIEGAPALIFRENGEWKVRINDTVGTLWADSPSAPAISETPIPAPILAAPTIGSGSIAAGTVEYFARYIVLTDGVITAVSPFSPMVQVVQAAEFGATFARPTAPEAGLTHIELYRRRTGETLANLVMRQDLNTPTLYDALEDGELTTPMVVTRTDASQYEFQYVVTWVRDIGGWEHESAPSPITVARMDVPGATITRPGTPPEYATYWRIYRISTKNDPTVSFQLVASVAASTQTYVDRTFNVNLGSSLAQQYTDAAGATVTAGVPDEQFTGMIGPVNGFYIGWYDNQLYLSEPGNPSWWPGAYVMQANANIIGVEFTGDRVIVVTEAGVQLAYGTTPAQFVLDPTTRGEGGVFKNAMYGGYYLGTDGIYQVTADGVTLVSQLFQGKYFKDLISASANFNVTMRWFEDRLFLFHSAGALCYDNRTQNWITFGSQYVFDYTFLYGGDIYGRNGAIIYSMFSGEGTTEYRYTTGNFDAGMPTTKFFEAVRLDGSGTVYVELLVDGSAVTTSTVDLDATLLTDRYVYFPNWVESRRVQITILGTGKVKTIRLEVHDSESEAR